MLRRPIAALAVIVSTVAVACSSAASDERTAQTRATGDSSSVETLVNSPTATTTSTTTTTTTPAATTSTTAASAWPRVPVVLRGDGVAGATFGDGDVATVAILTVDLDAPTSDELRSFPVQETADRWRDPTSDGGATFSFPVGRVVCFGARLCATFGGVDRNALRFVGWSYGGTPQPQPATADGVAIGSKWADLGATITRLPGGCYQTGTGTTTDGVQVALLSTGEWFSIFDEQTQTFVDGSPDPAEVTVLAMRAGSNIIVGDC
jgi:hypothetical protein